MPDWITHVIVGLILCEIFDLKPRSLVLLGSVLPDIILKIDLLRLLIHHDFEMYWYLIPGHSPIGVLLFALFIAMFFRMNQYKFIYLVSIGFMSHFLLDLMNKHYLVGQQLLLFPFSWKYLELGIMWYEYFWIGILVSGILYIMVKITKNS